MQVLISGSTGFVGRHFVRRLLAEHHYVVGVDIRQMPADSLIHSYKNRFFWVRDIREFVRAESLDQFDLVIHCAAMIGGRLNMENDPLGVAQNLSIDYELFNAVAKAKRQPHIIYFSSSAIYPPQLQTQRCHCLLGEGLVDLRSGRFSVPETTYGFAKFAGEYLAQQVVEKHRAHVAIYRPFGGYGEDQDLTYPFPAIVQRVMKKENPIVVWGSGVQKRDFIHIDDIVDIVLRTYGQMTPGATLNLGTGRATSFKALAELICHAANHACEIVADSRMPEGVFSRVCDKFEMDSRGIVPKISLEEGILRAIQYFRERNY